MSNQTIWTGKSSNKWSEPLNWTQGVPSIGVHAYIPSTDMILNFPIISKNLKVNFTLKNDGNFILKAELFIQNNGIIQNYGNLKNRSTGKIINEGNIMNFGEWINEGYFENKRLSTNNHRLFNEGIINNKDTFVNLGNLVNTGTIDNYKTINNPGSLENFKTLDHHASAELITEGFFPEDFTENSDEFFIQESKMM